MLVITHCGRKKHFDFHSWFCNDVRTVSARSLKGIDLFGYCTSGHQPSFNKWMYSMLILSFYHCFVDGSYYIVDC